MKLFFTPPIPSLFHISCHNLVRLTSLLERFRITFTPQTTNGRNDHVTMFILHLSLAVFSFSVKLSNFALALKARIILHCSHSCTYFIKNRISRLSFAVNAILNLSIESRRVAMSNFIESELSSRNSRKK